MPRQLDYAVRKDFQDARKSKIRKPRNKKVDEALGFVSVLILWVIFLLLRCYAIVAILG